jgi:dihydroflavonol-4-reductase
VRLFITGATGFIGTHLLERLAATEHELRCLVRRPGSARLAPIPRLTVVAGDVTDRESVRRGMAGCDAVLNLANVYSLWERDRRVYRAVNVDGTRNVLECALECGVAKAVHVSTAGIFGRPADDPFTEASAPGPVRFSEYAETKYRGDAIAWELYRTRGLPLVAIYPGAVLGPGDTKATGQYVEALAGRRLPVTVCEACALTYVHVRDVAETIVRALEKSGNLGEMYLVGKERLTFGEVNAMVCEIACAPMPRMRLPTPVAAATAALLTALSRLTGRPPAWGMSTDQLRMMREGFRFDGSKVERELGIEYTPVRVALAEMIAALHRS